MRLSRLLLTLALLLCVTSPQHQCVASDQTEHQDNAAEIHLEQDEADLEGGESDHEQDGGDKEGMTFDQKKLQWDPNGYFTFCPCMGRFGNQGEHYLGALAFGKALNRTIILPPFRTYKNIPFTDWFQFEPLLEFYPRLITMATFMEELAPTHWPESERKGYCWLQIKSDYQCEMKKGNPFGPFWDELGVDFAEELKFEIFSHADITKESGMQRIKQEWDSKMPASRHAVLALKGAPAPYPMAAGNRVIQNYFKWNPDLFAEAQHHMDEMFHGEPYVGIHLRTGIDWERVCASVDNTRQLMASPQCHTPGVEPVTKVMCFPLKDMVLEETRVAVETYEAKHLYIATDKLSYQSDFQKMFDDRNLQVTVHHLDPHLPQMDIIILGQSDFFIGNCVSSFTSFVKRERDGNGKPSTFWSKGL